MKHAQRAFGLVVVVWAIGAVALFGIHHDGAPVHADAVVVLEGSNSRLPRALELIQQGYAPVLVISRGDKRKLEQRVCGPKSGVSARVICFAASPPSTRGEAEEIGRLAQRHGWTTIDVVTSQFHVFRARLLIERCYHGGLHMVGSSQAEWKFPLYAVEETAKLVYQETVQRGC